MLHVLFHANGTVADVSEEAQEGYLPASEDCVSTLALRYKLVDGQATDMYPGKSDEEVLEAIKIKNDEEKAAVVEGKILDHTDFYNLFTIEELEAIYTLAKENVRLQIFLDKVKVAKKIVLSDPEIMLGLSLLVQATILTEERRTAILAG